MGAAQTLAWPNPHIYVPTKSIAAKARPVLAAGALVRCSVGAEFTKPVVGVSIRNLRSCKETFQLFFLSCMVPGIQLWFSAPPLHVGHPQGSAPEAALVHTSLPHRRGGAELVMARVARVPTAVGRGAAEEVAAARVMGALTVMGAWGSGWPRA